MAKIGFWLAAIWRRILKDIRSSGDDLKTY
jgi:hypothetical protein